MDITLRKYLNADFAVVAEGLRDLINLVAAEDPFIPALKTVQAGKDKLEQLLWWLSREVGTFDFMIAEDESGKVVGFLVALVRRPSTTTYSHQLVTVGVIQEFWVEQSMRGKGIGQQLMNAAREYFRQQDCAFMQLRALAANGAACGFYEKEGMRPRIVEYTQTL